MVVYKNTLHSLGIPHDWLASEILTLVYKPGQEKLHIQLMLMKWAVPSLLGVPHANRPTIHNSGIILIRIRSYINNPLPIAN